LRYLVENAGRLVTKDELIKTVWRNVVVTDESLMQCVSEVRHAIADDGQTVAYQLSSAFRAESKGCSTSRSGRHRSLELL
jgi:DNA-binding response OmpR family regulator